METQRGGHVDVGIVVMHPVEHPKALAMVHEAMPCVEADIELVYGFGETAVVERARKLGMLPIRAPVTPRALESACQEASAALKEPVLPIALGAEVPARLFDNEALAALLNIETKVRCECPRHLSDLVFRLSAFEAYSLDCENRNERDATLHAQLHRMVARARAQMEEALGYLIQFEGLEVAPMAEDAPPAE